MCSLHESIVNHPESALGIVGWYISSKLCFAFSTNYVTQFTAILTERQAPFILEDLFIRVFFFPRTAVCKSFLILLSIPGKENAIQTHITLFVMKRGKILRDLAQVCGFQVYPSIIEGERR